METKSKSSPANPDIALLTLDVKMQIRILHAKVTFLQETGGITEEIERMMTEFTAPYTKDNSLMATRPPAPVVAPAVTPKLLLNAETMQAHSGYIGPDWKHVLIKPGDIIIVYAYINEVTALGFNTRTNLGGRFPIATSKKVEPQPHVELDILFCERSCLPGEKEGPSSLAYMHGQYIRVCMREENKFAYGFNQSTLSMGRINPLGGFTKIEWHKET
ncbi:hypothetical protein LAWI1_G005417 [Lachnellula willkommii]|uniref:Uncharacterized protein n=1 Tax=Lachnellula willkommii TaxID=215461 RepID=A0A559MA85_9HELO|nr:hypothetical protein LAWI1_G005417 [Lachnellula willkommii]